MKCEFCTIDATTVLDNNIFLCDTHLYAFKLGLNANNAHLAAITELTVANAKILCLDGQIVTFGREDLLRNITGQLTVTYGSLMIDEPVEFNVTTEDAILKCNTNLVDLVIGPSERCKTSRIWAWTKAKRKRDEQQS